MKKRKELNRLLDTYETHIGTGSMKQAGRLLPVIIRKLVEIVDDATSSAAEVAEHNVPTKAYVEQQQPCAPCDVSIPNNPDLIEEFKTESIHIPTVVPEIDLDTQINDLLRELDLINVDDEISGTVELEDKRADYTISVEAAKHLASLSIDVESEVREALGDAMKRELEKEKIVPAAKPSRLPTRKTVDKKVVEKPKTAKPRRKP